MITERIALVAFLAAVLSACGVSGEIKGKVDDGIIGNSGHFGFISPADYTYNSSYINFSAGNVSLKTVNTTFNDSSTFGTGTHYGTQVSGNSLTLNTSGDTSMSSGWTPKYSSMIGYWKFDGNSTNSITAGINGTDSGTVTYSAAARVGTHTSSFAATGRVQFTGFGTALGAATQLAISFWMKPASTAQWSDAVSFGAGRFRFESSTATPSELTIFSPGIDSSPIVCTSCLSNNAWHHVVFSADGTNWYLYVNGTQKVTGTVDAGMNVGANMFVGDRDGAANAFTGSVDDLAVWKNASLTAADVSVIYNRQKQKYSGIYESPVIDMGASGATWTSLTSVATLPYFKELSASSETSTNYASIGGGLLTGIRGIWHFNEASYTGAANEIVDSSGNNAHGKFANTAGTGQALTKVNPGLFSNSLDIANSANNRVAWINTLPVATNTQTFSFWIKSSDLTAWSPIGEYKDASNYGWALQTNNATGQASLRIDTDGAANQIAAGGTIIDGRWHHVAVVINSNQRKMFVDGVKVVDSTFTLGTGFTASSLLVIGKTGGAATLSAVYDEMALWSRALADSEILELYRRGANRVTYQARSCIESTCSCKTLSVAPAGSATDCDGDGTLNASDLSDAHASTWLGPDGTASTYYSEVHNNTAVSAAGEPTGTVKTTGLSLDWSGAFFTAAARPSANQYFQYRAYLESDDENNLCSAAACVPSVTSISVGPTGRYYGGAPTIINNTALTYSRLLDLAKNESSACTKYQLSTDNGVTWKYWNGAAWATTANGLADSNYFSDLSGKLTDLPAGRFKFKAFLTTNTGGDFLNSCSLHSVTATFVP